MLKVLGMLQGTERHFVGWGGHCDGPFTNSPGACAALLLSPETVGVGFSNTKGPPLAFASLKAHSYNPAQLLLPARLPLALTPLLLLFQGPSCTLHGAPALTSHHSALTLLCPLPSHAPLGNGPSTRNSHFLLFTSRSLWLHFLPSTIASCFSSHSFIL